MDTEQEYKESTITMIDAHIEKVEKQLVTAKKKVAILRKEVKRLHSFKDDAKAMGLIKDE